jgi:hypothetical protein
VESKQAENNGETKAPSGPLECADGNGLPKPHYWHWKAGSAFKQRQCSTCGLVEDHPKLFPNP